VDGISFARPMLLAGMAGLLIPVVVHLLGRRRVPERPIATLRFLARAAARAERNWRLRRLLLLLARMLLLAALVLLFAGPGCEETGAGGRGGTTWFVILDTSPSMAARIDDGGTALGKARRELERILLAAAPEDRFFFATSLEPASGTDPGSLGRGREEVLGLIRGASPRHGRHDLHRAVERALGILEDASDGRILLATDMQESAWRSRQAVANPRRIPFIVIDAGSPEPVNAWIDAVEREPGRLLVRVGGQTRVGGRPVAVRMKPRSSAAVTAFPKNGAAVFHLPDAASAVPVSIRLSPGGDLEPDDRAEYLVPDEAPLRVLLVNGSPHGFELRDELLFVRRALAANAHLARRITTRELRPTDLDPAAIREADVIFLANVGALPDGIPAAISERIRQGAGLVFTAGDAWEPFVRPGGPEDAAARSIPPLLVGPIRDVVRLEGGDALRPPYERIDTASLGGPLEPLGNPAAGDLSAARIRSFWLIDAPAGVRVHARLENGSPLLLERSLGKGRLLLFATTVDRDGADLCLRPAFVPFLERLLLHAGGRLEPPVPAVAVAGRPLEYVFRRPAVVSGPGGGRTRVGPGLPAFVPPEPGRYGLAFDDGSTAAFWARTAATESDLRRIPPGELEAVLGKGRVVWNRTGDAATAGMTGRRDLSREAGFALLAALFAEALLSVRWRRRRAPDFVAEIAARSRGGGEAA